MPTTWGLQHPAAYCRWNKRPDSFLKGPAADVVHTYPLKQAKELCIDLGEECAGVTCESHEVACTPRSSDTPSNSPSHEVSYLKDCPPMEESPTPPPLPPGQLEVQPDPEQELLAGAAIVVIAHNRAGDFKSCLESLAVLKEIELFKIHVSLDDPNAFEAMARVAKEVADEAKHQVDISVWEQRPLEGDPSVHNEEQLKWFKYNTAKIAHHYWLAFEKTFMEHGYEYGIFLEEDLVVAPDFLALFRSTAWLLKTDPSLWCVSGWNDVSYGNSVSDQCRLQRTSYFPGLGFLLTRQAWLTLREQWPIAPTMGWDYWTRVAFRRGGKECIIPEVSRTHHFSAKGASVTKNTQLKLFKLMALANIPNHCRATGACAQFGDVSYLLENNFEEYVRNSVAGVKRTSMQALVGRNTQSLKAESAWVLAFKRSEYVSLLNKIGFMPRGTQHAIPSDVRAEHYGVMWTRHMESRANLLLVDKASSHKYLNPEERIEWQHHATAVTARAGESCTQACVEQSMECDAALLEFVNDCNVLRQHFPCEEGCAHQVGAELPVYVSDPKQPTYRQCLVTFISNLKCDTKHASTSRMCACVPHGHKVKA